MTFTVRAVRLLVLFGATVAALTFAGSRGEAHKAITSKYTFNQDVLPIFRDKCGRCHVEGGVAPMSLMNYQDAFPWAESIRTELISSRMPPWNADAGFGEPAVLQGIDLRVRAFARERCRNRGLPRTDRVRGNLPSGGHCVARETWCVKRTKNKEQRTRGSRSFCSLFSVLCSLVSCTFANPVL